MKGTLEKNRTMRRLLSVMLSVVMLLSGMVFPPVETVAETSATAEGYTAQSGDNVIFVGSGEQSTTLSDGISRAVEGKRNIVVIKTLTELGDMGGNMYSLGAKDALSGNENVIVTSYYNGVDYRSNGARIVLCTGSSAGRYVARCNLEFGYVKMVHKSPNDIFVCMSRNVTFARGFENEFPSEAASYRPLVITGYDKQLTASSSFSGNQTVCIESGEFQYVRGGDRRFTLNHGFTSNSGSTNIIINGGRFISSSESQTVVGAVAAHAQASTTSDASVYMEINGGVFEGPVYAYGYTNMFNTAPTVAADVTIRINGGTFNNGKVHAIQCKDTSDAYYTVPTGRYTLIVAGGVFADASFVGMGGRSEAYYDEALFSSEEFSEFSSVKCLYSLITLDLPCAKDAITSVTLGGRDIADYALFTDTSVTFSSDSLDDRHTELVITEQTLCGEVRYVYTVYKGSIVGENRIDAESAHCYLMYEGDDSPVCLNCSSRIEKTTCTECDLTYVYNKQTSRCFYKCKNCHTVADEILADGNGPVVFYLGSAPEGGNGKSADTAYRMIEDAYGVLVSAGCGGTIVMCGKSAPSETEFPDAGGKVIFTSLYNKVNYRNTKYARLQIQDRMIFNNDVEFNNFDFATTSAVKYIIMNWHDLRITNARTMANYSSGSMTTTATTGRNIIIGGYMVPGDTVNSTEYDNLNADQTIYIAGGVWLGIRGGNHRTAFSSGFGRVSGSVNITLKGGTYNNSADETTTLSEMGIEASGQNKIIAPYTGSITVEGGTYRDINFYGQSRKGASYYTPNNEGNIKITVNGGAYSNCGIYSYNPESGTSAPAGEFIVDIKKSKTFTAIDGTMARKVTGYKDNAADPDYYRSGVSEIRMTNAMTATLKPANFDYVALTDNIGMFTYLGSAVRTEPSLGQGVRVKFAADRLFADGGVLGREVVEFGVLVRRSGEGTVIYRENSDSIRNIAVVKAYSDSAPARLYSMDESCYVFTSVMTGIGEDAYAESFEYTPYARISDGKGGYYTVYGESVDESAYSVAVKIEQSGDEIPAYAAQILNKVRS